MTKKSIQPQYSAKSIEFLELHDVQRLGKAAKRGRYPHRDYCLVLSMFYHGLRVSEASNLQWSQIDFIASNMRVWRSKSGEPTVQSIKGCELRALRELRRQWPDSPFVFTSERGAPLSRNSIHHIIEQAGKLIGLSVYPHILRHSCGYYLANLGHDTRMIQGYLGHRSINSTVLYTALSPKRFESIQWPDI